MLFRYDTRTEKLADKYLIKCHVPGIREMYERRTREVYTDKHVRTESSTRPEIGRVYELGTPFRRKRILAKLKV